MPQLLHNKQREEGYPWLVIRKNRECFITTRSQRRVSIKIVPSTTYTPTAASFATPLMTSPYCDFAVGRIFSSYIIISHDLRESMRYPTESQSNRLIFIVWANKILRTPTTPSTIQPTDRPRHDVLTTINFCHRTCSVWAF